MKSIVFLGVSNSGKSFNKNLIKIYFKEKILYDYRSVILNFSHDLINLSFFDHVTLLYFKIIKSSFIKILISKNKNRNKNKTKSKKLNNRQKKIFIIKKNIFYLNYQNICKRLLSKLVKNDKKFYKFTINLINNLRCNKNFKKMLKFWFIEDYCAHHLIKNYKDKILLDSEGFIQRLCIYLYFSSTKKHYKIINNYLSLCPIPDQILITKYNKNKHIIKKSTLPTKINFKKEYIIFKKIRERLYVKIKLNKIKTDLYQINNRLNFNKIKL